MFEYNSFTYELHESEVINFLSWDQRGIRKGSERHVSAGLNWVSVCFLGHQLLECNFMKLRQ